jgi:ATP synthase protein I
MSNSDDPLPSLEALQRKIDEVKPDSGEKPSEGATRSSIGKAMRLGTDLLAGVGVGGVLGYFIDRFFETSPVFFIVFFFLGFAAGVRNILRSADKVDL